jgi:hypothetical protein
VPRFVLSHRARSGCPLREVSSIQIQAGNDHAPKLRNNVISLRNAAQKRCGIGWEITPRSDIRL